MSTVEGVRWEMNRDRRDGRRDTVRGFERGGVRVEDREFIWLIYCNGFGWESSISS
jgi:hypothetical protein